MSCSRCKSNLPTNANGMCSFCIADLRDIPIINEHKRHAANLERCVRVREGLRRKAASEARKALKNEGVMK